MGNQPSFFSLPQNCFSGHSGHTGWVAYRSHSETFVDATGLRWVCPELLMSSLACSRCGFTYTGWVLFMWKLTKPTWVSGCVTIHFVPNVLVNLCLPFHVVDGKIGCLFRLHINVNSLCDSLKTFSRFTGLNSQKLWKNELIFDIPAEYAVVKILYFTKMSFLYIKLYPCFNPHGILIQGGCRAWSPSGWLILLFLPHSWVSF